MGYWQIAAAVFALDTAVKYKMDQELPENGEGVPALGNAILLRKTYNKGAMLGLGKKSPKAVAGVTAALTAGSGAGQRQPPDRSWRRALQAGACAPAGRRRQQCVRQAAERPCDGLF